MSYVRSVVVTCASALILVAGSMSIGIKSALGNPACYREDPNGNTINLEEICEVTSPEGDSQHMETSIVDFDGLANHLERLPGSISDEEFERIAGEYGIDFDEVEIIEVEVGESYEAGDVMMDGSIFQDPDGI